MATRTPFRSTPTRYHGVLFASALEADWARCLDDRDIDWEYEPDELALADGRGYRPDFHLPDMGVWLEVKGPHNARLDKTSLMAEMLVHTDTCPYAEQCTCGYGPRYPWRYVVIGRPALKGRWTYEAAIHPQLLTPAPVVLICPTCDRHSFLDTAHEPACRCCGSDIAGATAYPSGTLPFRTTR